MLTIWCWSSESGLRNWILIFMSFSYNECTMRLTRAFGDNLSLWTDLVFCFMSLRSAWTLHYVATVFTLSLTRIFGESFGHSAHTIEIKDLGSVSPTQHNSHLTCSFILSWRPGAGHFPMENAMSHWYCMCHLRLRTTAVVITRGKYWCRWRLLLCSRNTPQILIFFFNVHSLLSYQKFYWSLQAFLKWKVPDVQQ